MACREYNLFIVIDAPCAPKLEKKNSGDVKRQINIGLQGNDKCISAPTVHLTDK